MRKRKHAIYVIEMWDEQFGWVRCMDGLDVPTCAIRRVTAKAKIQQIKQRFMAHPDAHFRIVRYQAVQS